MVEDHRPECYWCSKKMNKKARYHLAKTGEPLCYKCWRWFKEELKNFPTYNKGEQYP